MVADDLEVQLIEKLLTYIYRVDEYNDPIHKRDLRYGGVFIHGEFLIHWMRAFCIRMALTITDIQHIGSFALYQLTVFQFLDQTSSEHRALAPESKIHGVCPGPPL